MNEQRAINKAANVVMTAPSGTYNAAIRDLAEVFVQNLAPDEGDWSDFDKGMYVGLIALVTQALPSLVLDTDLPQDHGTSVRISHRLMELIAKNGEATK